MEGVSSGTLTGIVDSSVLSFVFAVALLRASFCLILELHFRNTPNINPQKIATTRHVATVIRDSSSEERKSFDSLWDLESYLESLAAQA